MNSEMEHEVSTDPTVNPGVRVGSLAQRSGKPYQWDQKASIRFEVAMDTINDEAGAWIARRYKEEEKENPDKRVIEQCSDAVKKLEERRRALLPTDTDGVEAVIQGAQERIEAIRQR